MNGMLSRASGNSPPQLNLQILQSRAQAPIQASKRHCKSSSWNGGRSSGDQYIGGEPTSVLDIRSPSPTSTSTLSSSLGGSGGSGAVAAVSGAFCEAVSDGKLLDPQESPPSQAAAPPPAASSGPWYGTKNSGNTNSKWSGEGSNWRLNSNSGGEGQSLSRAEGPAHGHGHGQGEWTLEVGSATAAATAGMDDLESILQSNTPAPDQSLMRWLLGEGDDPKDQTPAALPQIKGGEVTTAHHFEDNGMDSNFPDPGGFAFPTNNLRDVVVNPPAIPPPHNPAAFCPSYPTLPPLSLPRMDSASPPPPAAFGPISSAFQQPEQPPPVFAAPNSFLYGPAHFFKDPAQTNTTSTTNNVFFPVSYEMPLPKRLHGGVLPPEPLLHRPVPPPPPPPPLLWQQQGSLPGGFVKQEFMFKPQQQQQQQQLQHADLLQSLQRRHQQQQQQMLLLPQFQRLKGVGGLEEVQQTMVGQLLKAAEAVELGTFGHAQAILARLNQHLTPLGKPLHRAAYYFKEALSSRIHNNGRNATPPLLSPMEIVHKISAYKCFSEVSPLAQFANFTANQALLEAVEGADAVHMIDFEIGLGGQWASFLQELALRMGGPPSVRLTALGSGSASAVEMQLARENLEHFAKELNINFEFNVLDLEERIESLSIPMLQLRDQETVAVNLSLGMQRLMASFSSPDSIASLLRLIKELAPKALVVVEGETDRAGTSSSSFVQHFVEALQFYSFLFDSLEAVNMNMDAVHKVEKFLLAPKIESLVVAGSSPAQSSESKQVPHWRSLFLSAGLTPVPFSNFTETQAEYLIRRLPGRGFDVVKDHAILLLAWQGRPLVSASLWKCC